MTTTPPREQLPPLPPRPNPAHRSPTGTGVYFDAFTGPQMDAHYLQGYNDAREALRAQAASVEAVPSDGWLEDRGLLYRLTDEMDPQNCDEIKITMVDGSLSEEARSRRARELLDRIRTPAHIPADVSPPQAPQAVVESLSRMLAVFKAATKDCVYTADVAGLLAADIETLTSFAALATKGQQT